jgi:hypothetical protein
MSATFATTAVRWGQVIAESDGLDAPNERVIELPLALEHVHLERPGWVLDAGCALIPSIHAVPPELEPIARIVHLTQAIASERIKPRGGQLSFVSADLRDLRIFADQAFDRVACISTLEHVGFDNAQYGGAVERAYDSWILAVSELCRVTRDALLITVPYHSQPAQCERWRYFSPKELITGRWPEGFTGDVRFYGRLAHGWCGGDVYPMVTRLESFPDKVNQIACIRLTRG